MQGSRFVLACLAAATVLTMPAAASAQTPEALRQEIDQLRKDFEVVQKQYGERLSALEAKLGTAQPSAPAPQASPVTPAAPPLTAEVPPGAGGAGGPSGSLPVYGGAAAGSKIFNPDIAVIGDFLGAAGHNTVNPTPALEMHESEASFQAVVDPYARADFFIAFGQEGVDLEEGFITFPTVPGGLLVKVGKLRAAFGKVNTLHNHVLTWTDRPLVTNNLVGGEEGIGDGGISVARLISNPWIFLEATGEVYRGNSADVFTSSSRGRSELRRSPPGLSGHHREHEHRRRRLVRTWTQQLRCGGRHRRRSFRDWSVGCRRHPALEAAAAIHLSLVRGTLRADLERPRTTGRAAARLGLLRLR